MDLAAGHRPCRAAGGRTGDHHRFRGGGRGGGLGPAGDLRPDRDLAVPQLEGARAPGGGHRGHPEHDRGHPPPGQDAGLRGRPVRRRPVPGRYRRRPVPHRPDRGFDRGVRPAGRDVRRRGAHPHPGPARRHQHRRRPAVGRDRVGHRGGHDPPVGADPDVGGAGRQSAATDARRRVPARRRLCHRHAARRRAGAGPARSGDRGRGRGGRASVAVPSPGRQPQLRPAVVRPAGQPDGRPDPPGGPRLPGRDPRHAAGRGLHDGRHRGPERDLRPVGRRPGGPLGPAPDDDRRRPHPRRAGADRPARVQREHPARLPRRLRGGDRSGSSSAPRRTRSCPRSWTARTSSPPTARPA